LTQSSAKAGTATNIDDDASSAAAYTVRFIIDSDPLFVDCELVDVQLGIISVPSIRG